MTANHRPLEESDIELIERVRATPCLYNTKDPSFRLVYKKEEEWQSIAEGLDMTHWEARKRWTVLRDRYARELKQLILHPNGTEYGNNDFFKLMDFIRNFVKKREAKRKRSNENYKPVKRYKVNCDYNSLESDSNDIIQQNKSYIFEDSQNLSQESLQQNNNHSDIIEIDQNVDEQEYNEYAEDTSAAYETIEEHEIIGQENVESYVLTSPTSEKNMYIKPECSKLVKEFSITAVEVDNENTVSQKPILKAVSTDEVNPNLPVHVEEYFSKTIALYLRQLSPRFKIKAKVEMMQIIEKYINLEESKS